MLVEEYLSYRIEALPLKTHNGKWQVTTRITREFGNKRKSADFVADDKTWYILEIEAAKECINLGKLLIKQNRVGF